MFNQFLSALLTPDTLINFGFWLVVLALLRKKFAAALNTTLLRAILAGVAVAGVLAFTVRVFSTYTFSTSYWLFSPMMWGGAFDVFSGNWILNFALFVPAGFALTFSGRGYLQSFLFLSLLSLGIECLQFWARSGIADPADFMSNSAGAAGGVLIGSLVLRLIRRSKVGSQQRLDQTI